MTEQGNDALAVPIDFEARYGVGLERGLVLGGGGIVFVAWLVAYLAELAAQGLDLSGADRIVGTSAGSIVATVVASGHIERVGKLLNLAARRPAIIERMAGGSELSPSQQRAVELFLLAGDARPETIRAIGHAALAAQTPSPQLLPSSLLPLVGTRSWPSPRLWISAVDTFSGERLAMAESSDVSLLRAIAASASVPGIFRPQQIGDRRVMDGGISGTGIHSDLVAGARRALVLSLNHGMAEPMGTQDPGSQAAS